MNLARGGGGGNLGPVASGSEMRVGQSCGPEESDAIAREKVSD